MSEKHKTVYKPLFIWTLIISIITILIMSLVIAYNVNQVNYYRENYEYKCYEGTHQVCVEDGKRSAQYGEDEDYIVCDTDRFEIARCVPENFNRWTTCQSGYSAVCIDFDDQYIANY